MLVQVAFKLENLFFGLITVGLIRVGRLVTGIIRWQRLPLEIVFLEGVAELRHEFGLGQKTTCLYGGLRKFDLWLYPAMLF
jgi:hypothetical protein